MRREIPGAEQSWEVPEELFHGMDPSSAGRELRAAVLAVLLQGALSSSRAGEVQAAPGTGNGMFETGKRLQLCTRRVRRRTGDVFREIPVWEEEIPKAGSPSQGLQQGQDFQTLLKVFKLIFSDFPAIGSGVCAQS